MTENENGHGLVIDADVNANANPRRLALIGFRGTGKTTVGGLIARRLGAPFVDLDAAIERRLGRSVAAIFREDGEAAFRDEEQRALSDLVRDAGPEGLVLATGGGAILRDHNRDLLRRFGPVVWLDAAPGTVLGRLARSPRGQRPALTDQPFEQEVLALLAAREPLYRATASLRIVTDGRPPERVASEVIDALGLIGART